MEKKMENEMETGVISWFLGDIVLKVARAEALGCPRPVPFRPMHEQPRVIREIFPLRLLRGILGVWTIAYMIVKGSLTAGLGLPRSIQKWSGGAVKVNPRTLSLKTPKP